MRRFPSPRFACIRCGHPSVLQEDMGRLTQEVARLHAALTKYGRHPEGAGCRSGNGCFCGLESAALQIPVARERR